MRTMTGRGFAWFSLWVLLYRLGAGALLCLVIYYTDVDIMIDVAKFGVNEEYVVYMLIASIVVGFLAAVMVRTYDHNKAADNKAAAGTIESTNDLPYDKRYDLCTAVAFVIGAAIGMYAAPVIVDAFFVNAGMYTYVGVAAVASAAMVFILIRLFHLGVREFIIQASKYAVDTAKAAKEAKKNIDEAKEIVDEVVPELNQKL